MTDAQLEAAYGAFVATLNDERARLRAEMPSEGERRDLKTLREVRADEFAVSSAASIRSMCRGEVALRVLPGSYAQACWLTLAALLAPEVEVAP